MAKAGGLSGTLMVSFTIEGISPLSQSRPVQSIKDTGETHDAFEQRTWRERMHVDAGGQVIIPPMAIKNALGDCAKYLSESVPGKGKSTYTKHFEAGVMAVDPIPLGVKAADVPGERLFVPSDGRRGGGARVWKTFPLINPWSGPVTLYVIDPVLTAKPEVIERYLGHCGKFIGIGRFRPRNAGFYGRFVVKNFEAAMV